MKKRSRIGTLALSLALFGCASAAPPPAPPPDPCPPPPPLPVATPAPSHYEKLATASLANGPLSAEDAQAISDEIVFQRAVQLYLWALPSINMYGMKEGAEKTFGQGYNVLSVFKDRLNAKTLITTPNSDVIYALGFLDLKEDGPLVIEVPPGLQGMLDDFRQRPLHSIGKIDGKEWIGDVGFGGPDKGKGGKYLVVPPDYDKPLPKGYFAFRSRTYGVFVFWRGFFKDPKDLSEPVRVIEQTKIYPLGKKDSAKPMEFPNASAKPANLLYPHDDTAFDLIDRFIQHEAVDPEDFEFRGIAAALGIVKGQTFSPTREQRKLLGLAAETAWRMGHQLNTALPRYYTDRKWVQGLPPIGADFSTDSYIHVDRRTSFFTLAYSASPVMFLNVEDVGSKYPSAFVDADGNPFSGDHTYKLNLPPNIPAKFFWSVTLYDPITGSGLDNGQPFPSLNQMDKPPTNSDGSIDIYFGPESPGEGKNWIRTVPGKPFFVNVRLYAPTKPFFDQTWRPSDVVKLK